MIDQPIPRPPVPRKTIAILGLGCVGLPLAVAFSRDNRVIGYDVDSDRLERLSEGYDIAGETSSEELAGGDILFTDEAGELRAADIYIAAVPTPIDACRRPDLNALRSVSESIGAQLCPDNLVIYESTVYPGCTEEYCVPILERVSGLVLNRDFFVGYSPERINPGDKDRSLGDIVKITSGSSPEAAAEVDALYASIVKAGTFPVSGIRVAEAAKLIENTQRDVNIALVNEFARIFKSLRIDTQEVLAAAGSKWNFLPFRPGLVGGNCIGVAPHYLVHGAERAGYYPEIVSAARRLNERTGRQVAAEVMRLMVRRRVHVAGAEVLVLGLSFKPNCRSVRGTLVVDIIDELEIHGARVGVYDPRADPAEAHAILGRKPLESPGTGYDAVVLAVGHDCFEEMGQTAIRGMCRAGGVLYDVTYLLPSESVDGCL